jgi:hypothetical protein
VKKSLSVIEYSGDQVTILDWNQKL